MIIVPIGPETPTERLPVATVLAMVVAVVMWLTGLGFGVPELAGLAGFRPAAGWGLTLVTYPFVHASLAHLTGNMMFLWVFGPSVEAVLGRLGFAIAWVVLAALSGLAQGMTSDAPGDVIIGASGVISGLMGLYAALIPRGRVRVAWFLWWGFGARAGVSPVPIAWFAGLWIAGQAFWLWYQWATGVELSVAITAHLAGFALGWLGGLALALALRRRAPALPGASPPPSP